MIRVKRMVVALVVCLIADTALADQWTAPFGLEWGMSVQDAEGLGIKLQPIKSEDGTKAFVAQGLPKVLGDTDWVRLDFGYSNKLRKVVAAGRPFKNDPYGRGVLVRYGELLQLLQSKYGVGKSTHKKGDSIYAQPEYFLAGLRSGRSWHYTNFVERGGSIELSVRATDSDTGNWVLIYEDRALAGDVEKEKRAREKESL
jgi:hypothetical protein